MFATLCTTQYLKSVCHPHEHFVYFIFRLLQNYYEKAYGHHINSVMSCPLLADIFRSLDKAINNTWDYENLPSDAYQHG